MCYAGGPGQAGRRRVGYRLVCEGGRASLSDVRLVSAELDAPELEGCVLDAMRRLTWTDRGAPDMGRAMELQISILDLKARAARDDHADDAPDENDLDD